MRKLIVPAAAIAVLATATLGFAATNTAGVVKAYDAHAMTLTLADGSIYTLKKSFKDPGLKAGEKVNVSWELSGSKKLADKVTLEK